MTIRVEACGDAMLLVQYGSVIDVAANDRVMALAARLRRRGIQGVQDLVPGYCTLGVHFEPLHTDIGALERAIQDDDREREQVVSRVPSGPPIEIPVRYGGDAGPDLDAVASFARCSAEEVIARHLARVYRVYMLGFIPGFAYLGQVDRSIAAPRRRVPRARVPAGSVGIAGEQTGVYPTASPGGWQLIGRTDVRMFDPTKATPSLLTPGDTVRFVRAPESAE